MAEECQSRADLEGVSIALLQDEMPVPRPIRLLGVWLPSLLDEEHAGPQLDLPI